MNSRVSVDAEEDGGVAVVSRDVFASFFSSGSDEEDVEDFHGFQGQQSRLGHSRRTDSSGNVVVILSPSSSARQHQQDMAGAGSSTSTSTWDDDESFPITVNNIPVFVSQTSDGSPLYIRQYPPTLKEMLAAGDDKDGDIECSNFDGFSEASDETFEGFSESELSPGCSRKTMCGFEGFGEDVNNDNKAFVVQSLARMVRNEGAKGKGVGYCNLVEGTSKKEDEECKIVGSKQSHGSQKRKRVHPQAQGKHSVLAVKKGAKTVTPPRKKIKQKEGPSYVKRRESASSVKQKEGATKVPKNAQKFPGEARQSVHWTWQNTEKRVNVFATTHPELSGRRPRHVPSPGNPDYIGEHCNAVGCTVRFLERKGIKDTKLDNGIVIELVDFAKRISWENEFIVRWLQRLSGWQTDEPVEEEDLRSIQAVIKRRKAILTIHSGNPLIKTKLRAFDDIDYTLPSVARRREGLEDDKSKIKLFSPDKTQTGQGQDGNATADVTLDKESYDGEEIKIEVVEEELEDGTESVPAAGPRDDGQSEVKEERREEHQKGTTGKVSRIENKVSTRTSVLAAREEEVEKEKGRQAAKEKSTSKEKKSIDDINRTIHKPRKMSTRRSSMLMSNEEEKGRQTITQTAREVEKDDTAKEKGTTTTTTNTAERAVSTAGSRKKEMEMQRKATKSGEKAANRKEREANEKEKEAIEKEKATNEKQNEKQRKATEPGKKAANEKVKEGNEKEKLINEKEKEVIETEKVYDSKEIATEKEKEVIEEERKVVIEKEKAANEKEKEAYEKEKNLNEKEKEANGKEIAYEREKIANEKQKEGNEKERKVIDKEKASNEKEKEAYEKEKKIYEKEKIGNEKQKEGTEKQKEGEEKEKEGNEKEKDETMKDTDEIEKQMRETGKETEEKEESINEEKTGEVSKVNRSSDRGGELERDGATENREALNQNNKAGIVAEKRKPSNRRASMLKAKEEREMERERIKRVREKENAERANIRKLKQKGMDSSSSSSSSSSSRISSSTSVTPKESILGHHTAKKDTANVIEHSETQVIGDVSVRSKSKRRESLDKVTKEIDMKSKERDASDGIPTVGSVMDAEEKRVTVTPGKHDNESTETKEGKEVKEKEEERGVHLGQSSPVKSAAETDESQRDSEADLPSQDTVQDDQFKVKRNKAIIRDKRISRWQNKKQVTQDDGSSSSSASPQKELLSSPEKDSTSTSPKAAGKGRDPKEKKEDEDEDDRFQIYPVNFLEVSMKENNSFAFDDDDDSDSDGGGLVIDEGDDDDDNEDSSMKMKAGCVGDTSSTNDEKEDKAMVSRQPTTPKYPHDKREPTTQKDCHNKNEPTMLKDYPQNKSEPTTPKEHHHSKSKVADMSPPVSAKTPTKTSGTETGSAYSGTLGVSKSGRLRKPSAKGIQSIEIKCLFMQRGDDSHPHRPPPPLPVSKDDRKDQDWKPTANFKDNRKDEDGSVDSKKSSRKSSLQNSTNLMEKKAPQLSDESVDESDNKDSPKLTVRRRTKKKFTYTLTDSKYVKYSYRDGHLVPKFRQTNVNLGPHCAKAGITVHDLNASNTKDVTLTNGIVKELHDFYAARKTTKTALAIRLFQMKGKPLLDEAHLLSAVLRISKAARYSMPNKEFLLPKRFCFRGSFGSMEDGAGPSPQKSKALHAKRTRVKKFERKRGIKPEDSDDEHKHDRVGRDEEEEEEEEEEEVMNNGQDTQITCGQKGSITRGDIVHLYSKWLSSKMSKGSNTFVTDLLRSVEQLMAEREVPPLRIPAGTLMSSSVKLHDEYQQILGISKEDAVMYLQEDWLEDINYLVSLSGPPRRNTTDGDASVSPAPLTATLETNTERHGTKARTPRHNSGSTAHRVKEDNRKDDSDFEEVPLKKIPKLKGPHSQYMESVGKRVDKRKCIRESIEEFEKEILKEIGDQGDLEEEEEDMLHQLRDSDEEMYPGLTLPKEKKPKHRKEVVQKRQKTGKFGVKKAKSKADEFRNLHRQPQMILDYQEVNCSKGATGKHFRYLVRWVGRGPEDDSWVADTNLRCPKILREFWHRNCKAVARSQFDPLMQDNALTRELMELEEGEVVKEKREKVRDDSVVKVMVKEQTPNQEDDSSVPVITKRDLLTLYDNWRQENQNERRVNGSHRVNSEVFKGRVRELFEARGVTFHPESLLNACFMMMLMRVRLQSSVSIDHFLDSSCLEVLEASQKQYMKRKESQPEDLPLSIRIKERQSIPGLQNELQRLRLDLKTAHKWRVVKNSQLGAVEEELHCLENAVANSETNTDFVQNIGPELQKLKSEISGLGLEGASIVNSNLPDNVDKPAKTSAVSDVKENVKGKKVDGEALRNKLLNVNLGKSAINAVMNIVARRFGVETAEKDKEQQQQE